MAEFCTLVLVVLLFSGLWLYSFFVAYHPIIIWRVNQDGRLISCAMKHVWKWENETRWVPLRVGTEPQVFEGTLRVGGENPYRYSSSRALKGRLVLYRLPFPRTEDKTSPENIGPMLGDVKAQFVDLR